jgi:hypothetical protein
MFPDTDTDCVGTLQVNRENVPPLVKAEKLKKGEVFGQNSGIKSGLE